MRIRRFQLSDLLSELLQKLSSDINKSKRELFLNGAFSDQEHSELETTSQATNCRKTFEVGSRLQIPGKTTTLLVNLNIAEPQHGGFMVKLSPSGSILVQVRSYGSMGNVSVFCSHPFLGTHGFHRAAGAGKSVLWYVDVDLFSFLFSNQKPSPSSSIIQDIRGMCESGLASLAFFYCDFKEDQKKDRRGLLTSVLVQLCGQSDAYYDGLSKFYLAHDDGSQHASNSELAQCLKHLLELPEQATAYVVIDALDECPTATGLPSPREEVLKLVKELVGLQIPNLRICVTSRPEADIEPVLGPLAFRSVSLHGESGQAKDIEEYIRFVVNTDPKMQVWRAADKELIIETLTKKADGM